MRNSCLVFISLLLISVVVTGQTTEKKRYTATKVTVAPSINGILDDDTWKEGTWIDDFTQYEPYNGAKASQRT